MKLFSLLQQAQQDTERSLGERFAPDDADVTLGVSLVGQWRLEVRVPPEDRRQHAWESIVGAGSTPEEAYQTWLEKLSVYSRWLDQERARRRAIRRVR